MLMDAPVPHTTSSSKLAYDFLVSYLGTYTGTSGESPVKAELIKAIVQVGAASCSAVGDSGCSSIVRARADS